MILTFRTRALLALLAVSLPLAAAGAAGAARPADRDPKAGGSFTYALPGDRVFPEGIAVSGSGQRFYVTSTTDGTIFRGLVKGHAAAEVFLPGGQDGRTTAAGVKVDDGRLFVAGGATGTIFVYDVRSRTLLRRYETGTGGFLNDVAIAPNGDAYVTDSKRPFLFRIAADELRAGAGPSELQPFLTYPSFQAAPAFNANGIVAVDRRTLVYVQSATGRLFRVDLRTQAVQAIDLGGASVTAGDGLVLSGRTLYVVRNALGVITRIRLAGDVRSGRVVSETADPTFRYPTTAAPVRGRLLVVNSQFGRRSAGQPPELPFTVSSIRRP